MKIPCIYEEAKRFLSGLASVRMDGKFGFINNSGSTKLPFIYDRAGVFSHDGLAYVSRNGITFYIATDGFEYFSNSDEP